MDQRDGDDGDGKVPSGKSIAVDSWEGDNAIVHALCNNQTGERPSP